MYYVILGLQLILSLSILVIIHELGHFIPAKLFKTKVEKFYLFFDPWFSLFKIKKGETEYGVGWLPLGGYVKIAGMVDESMDKEQLEKPAEPWEFRSKPTWQRLIIMVGGVTMNVILAWIIYTGVLMKWGEEYLPVKNATYGVVADSVLLDHGFKNGDRILTMEGVEPLKFTEINKAVILEGARTFEVERNGAVKEIILPQNINEKLLERGAKMLFFPAFPFYVDSIVPGYAASNIGLRKGDKFLAVNNKPMYLNSFALEIGQNRGKEVSLTAKRGDTLIFIPKLTVPLGGKIGVVAKGMEDEIPFETIEYNNVAQAFWRGMVKSKETIAVQASSIKLLFSKAGAKQLSGFGGIASLFSPEWDWQVFWEMTALISLILAFMNILPIPALDGGHVVFLLYEMVSGRKPNKKVLEYAQIAGMILLIALVLYANANDLFKAINN